MYYLIRGVIVFVILGFLISVPFFEKQLYPQFNKDIVEYLSSRYDVESNLVYAVIFVESKGDRFAESSKGALGLMQIIPNTGKNIAQRYPLEIHSEVDLHDEYTNILLGVIYLSEKLKAFDDKIIYALAAYNAGESKVNQWIEESIRPYYSHFYKETLDYSDRVIMIKNKYDKIYP